MYFSREGGLEGTKQKCDRFILPRTSASFQIFMAHIRTSSPGGSLREGKKSVPERQCCTKTACSSYVQPWLVAVGGWWRLVVGGWW